MKAARVTARYRNKFTGQLYTLFNNSICMRWDPGNGWVIIGVYNRRK